MAAHSSILACRIPWTEEPGELPSMGPQSQTPLKRLSTHTYHLKTLLQNSIERNLLEFCGALPLLKAKLSERGCSGTTIVTLDMSLAHGGTKTGTAGASNSDGQHLFLSLQDPLHSPRGLQQHKKLAVA